jgi:hypothetical protein
MICIDSRKQLIELGKNRTLIERAEERMELYHYTSLSALQKILEGKSLKFNNLNNYNMGDSYEKEGTDENSRGCVFISCMTHGKECKNMWQEFGDAKKGAKLIFKYKGVFHDVVFDKDRKVEAYSSNNILINKYGFSITNTKSNQISISSKFNTDIKVELILSDVEYSHRIPNSMVSEKYLNLSSVSKTVLTDFNDEFETRVIGILRSIKERYEEDIAYLLVPINFDNFKFEVKFGEQADAERRVQIEQLLNKL